MKIVLFQPEIPQNTGNIIRTCSVTNSQLIIVTPFSFSLSEKNLRRAGLDYFEEVKIQKIDDLEKYLEDQKSFFFFSSKATKLYTEVSYQNNTLLIFGSETSGLPKHYYEKYKDFLVKIPMNKNARCLNLSNSVAIGLYEALRQTNFVFEKTI